MATLLHSPLPSSLPNTKIHHPNRKMGTTHCKSSPKDSLSTLQSCIDTQNLSQGRQIHAQIIKNGEFHPQNDYLETKLIIFYSKCQALEAAFNLFSRQLSHNVFSWSAIIGMLVNEGLWDKALAGVFQMMAEGTKPDNFVVPIALKACSSGRMTGFGAGLHGFAVKMGYCSSCVFVQSGLVDFYGKSGLMESARKVFDEMPERNTVAWNSILVGYLQNGDEEEAIRMFLEMRAGLVEPSRVTIAGFLSAAANLRAVGEGRQGHAVAVLSGLALDAILSSSLINFYCKVGLMEDAEMVFVKTMERDTVIWNLLISGYLQGGLIEKALETCRRMRMNNQRFDSVTLSSILSASAVTGDLALGEAAHGYCIRNFLYTDPSAARGIIDMYGSCGEVDRSRRVFDSIKDQIKDPILWNAQLAAYAQCRCGGEALKLFYQMQLESFIPSVVSWNTVISALMRGNQVEEAYEMFAQMKSADVAPNVVTWTTMISGSAQTGRGSEAMQLFRAMQVSGLRPNLVSVLAVTSACTDVAALCHAKAMHAFCARQGFCTSVQVLTAIVDMYAKCGDLALAVKFFEQLQRKELPIYNAMILGYALHGNAGKGLDLFAEMLKEGVSPDVVTFTGLLTACSHAGLVDEGLKLFSEMGLRYNISPGVEHYGCVVNLLARKGDIDSAIKIIGDMPFAPDAKMLGSLLAACKDHKRMELTDYLSQRLLEMEPDNPANDVALSITYAADGRWEEASRIRADMRERGLKKDSGQSWIQVGMDVMTFVAGDRSRADTERLNRVLHSFQKEMGDVE